MSGECNSHGSLLWTATLTARTYNVICAVCVLGSPQGQPTSSNTEMNFISYFPGWWGGPRLSTRLGATLFILISNVEKSLTWEILCRLEGFLPIDLCIAIKDWRTWIDELRNLSLTVNVLLGKGLPEKLDDAHQNSKSRISCWDQERSGFVTPGRLPVFSFAGTVDLHALLFLTQLNFNSL